MRYLHFSNHRFEVNDRVIPPACCGKTSEWPDSDPTKVHVYAVGHGDLAALWAAELGRGRRRCYVVDPDDEPQIEAGFGRVEDGARWAPMRCSAATVTVPLDPPS